MEQIEVGEYVRTDKGTIGKVVEIRLGTNDEIKNFINIYFLDNCKWTIKDYIMKHSKNLIDLIEVGDYVNGKLVSNVDKVDNINFIEWDDGDMYKTEISNNKFIKSIVTKEQFASMEYKIGE